jgi:hypothetical protein
MSRKLIYLLFALSVCAIGVYAVLHLNAPPSGIESKGDGQSAVAEYVSLATAIVSCLTAIVGLIKTERERKQSD